MSRRATQAVIERAIKAVLAGGVPMERIKGVRTSGEDVTVLIGDPAPDAKSQNEWDEVLK